MPSEHLRRRLASVSWPQMDDTDTEPIPGDLWLATWERTRVLVFVLEATATTVDVAATTSPQTGDDHTVIVPEDEAPVTGAAIHIWARCQVALPRRALALRLGAAPSWVPVVKAAADEPTGTFPPISNATDPRAERRAALEDDLAALAQARWQPEIDVRLGDLIPGIRPGRLAQLTGLEPGDADQVLDGYRPLNNRQAEAVAEAYDLGVGEVVRASQPRVSDNIVTFFDEPARLRAVRRRATQLGRTEPEVMLDVAIPLMQQAARTTGHTERDWGALIDDALAD